MGHFSSAMLAGTCVEMPGGQLGYAMDASVVRLPDGTHRTVRGLWKPAKAVEFDIRVVDSRWVEHWAVLRVAMLVTRAEPVSTEEWREAVGGAPVLVVAARLGWVAATPLLAAFGIVDLGMQYKLAEWAQQLPIDAMPEVRQVAGLAGVGPVLAALELAGYMSMYSQLADEEGVETCAGLAWR